MSELAISSSTQASASEFRQGWSVVLVCFCVATFAWGFGFYGQSVYLADLHATRGWPTSLIASATTVNYLTGALLLSRVHRAIEVLGPRLLLAGGVAIMAVSAIGLSRVQTPWQLYLCSIVMAIGWAGTTTTAIATTLAYWFDARRGLALSLALTGASAGGFTIAPLLVRLVPRMGLEQAVLLIAVGGLAILLPMVFAGVGRIAIDRPCGRIARGVAGGTCPAHGVSQPGAGVAQPALLVGSIAVRTRTRGTGRLHRAPGGVPAAASRQQRCRHRHRCDRDRGGGGTACLRAADRLDEPARRRGRLLRIAGTGPGPDAGAAGSERSLVSSAVWCSGSPSAT